MSESSLSCKRIAFEVNRQLIARQLTVRECSEAFNLAYASEIRDGRKKQMTKDAVHRIRNNRFEVINERVANLCDFLNIEIENQLTNKDQKHSIQSLQKEFEMVEKIVKTKPELEKTVRSFLKNLVAIGTYKGHGQ